jgi:beta-fructofuranosidase
MWVHCLPAQTARPCSRRADKQPVFVPDQPYDKDGIFTGCLHPSSPSGDPNGLSIFYTSVPRIPIHWTQPHVRGQEGVALATSDDGGKTCKLQPAMPQGLKPGRSQRC